MGPGYLWALILAIGAGTFGLRLSFVLLFGRVDTVPPRVEHALELVPAAVLAALVAPALLTTGDALALAGTDRLLAGALAAVVAWRTENMVVTIAVGMGTIWALGAVG